MKIRRNYTKSKTYDENLTKKNLQKRQNIDEYVTKLNVKKLSLGLENTRSMAD